MTSRDDTPTERLDVEAAAHQVESMRPAMIRKASAITGNPATGEEAVQDANLQLVRSIDTIRDPGQFKPWIWRVVTNCAISVRRREAKHRQVIPLSEVEHGSRHPTVEDDTEGAQLRAAIDWLEKAGFVRSELRDYIQMRLEGQSWQEVADAAGVALPTIKAWLRSAVQMVLQATDEADGEEPSSAG